MCTKNITDKDEDTSEFLLVISGFFFLFLALTFIAVYAVTEYQKIPVQCKNYHSFLRLTTNYPIVSYNSLEGKCYKFNGNSWIQQTPFEEQLSK